MTNGDEICASRLKSGPLPFTTAKGEAWQILNTPSFRPTECPTAWMFCSTFGRLMSNDGTILEATRGERKIVSIRATLDGEITAGDHDLGIHTIVLHTFTGPPPSSKHTGDHINRIPWDNRVSNLRWATPEEQLANRTAPKRKFVLRDKTL